MNKVDVFDAIRDGDETESLAVYRDLIQRVASAAYNRAVAKRDEQIIQYQTAMLEAESLLIGYIETGKFPTKEECQAVRETLRSTLSEEW